MRIIAIVLGSIGLSVAAQASETILSPRSPAEHQADMKALQDKYGPAKSGPVLEADSKPAPFALSASPSPTPTPATKADAAPRVRVNLKPDAGNRFRLNDESLDTTAMIRKLGDLHKRNKIDAILLLEDPEQGIEAGHIVELAKIGKALKLPTLYQQGQDLKSISAQ